MIRRISLLFLEFFAGLVAGAVVLAFVMTWWLWSGPVKLTFLTPYIERALSPKDSTIVVEIEDTVLQWAGWERAADVRVRNVRVLDLDRRVIAELPQVSLGLSLRAMLRGIIAPTYLEIINPSVSAVRGVDGRFTIGLAVGAEKSDGERRREDVVLEGLIAELLAQPDTSRPLGYLKRISIVDADLTVEDHKLGRVWHAPRADVDFVRNAVGISANAVLDLDLEGKRSRVTGVASYKTESGIIDATLYFTDFDPAPFLRGASLQPLNRLTDLGLRLNGSLGFRIGGDGAVRTINFDMATAAGQFVGELAIGADGYGVSTEIKVKDLQWAALATAFPDWDQAILVDVPIAGTISVQGTTDGSVVSLDFDLTGGAGEIYIPQIYPQAHRIAGARLRGRAVDDFRRIRIEEARLQFEQGEVNGRATLTRVGDYYSLRLDGGMSGFSAPMFPKYWPPDLSVDVREWILKNIRKGRIDDASLSLVARFPVTDPKQFEIGSLNGSLRVSGGEVDYFSPLPVLSGIHADMTFTEKRFDIAISDGSLLGLAIDNGTVVITGLDVEDQDISIDAVLRGPVGDAAAVLDSEPLRFIADLGLDAAALSGETAVRLVLNFPIAKKIPVDQIAIAAGATLRDVTVKDGPFGFALSDGALELQLTGLGMTVTGTATLNGVPVNLNWRENFSDVEEFERRFVAKGVAGNAARRALRLPDLPFLDGDVSAVLAYTAFRGGRREVVAKIDLTTAALDFPYLRWRKQSGVPGKLYMFVTTEADGTTTIEDLRLDAGDMRFKARIVPTADFKGVRLIEIRDLKFAGNEMRGRVRFAEDGGVDVELAGARIDIGPFLASENEVDAIATTNGRPIRIKARFNEVLLGEGRLLNDVNAVLRRDGANWRHLALDTGIGGDVRLAVNFIPVGDGATLSISTMDAGKALQAADWTRKLKGGKLLVTGGQSAPGGPIIGKFQLKKFTVTDAPALARVLQVLSLTGIFSVLNQDGLDFVMLDGDFRYYGGALEIKNTRAFGSSIGITVEGAVYIEDETAALSGTVVPAYTINQVLGSIPILGTLLTGGKNEGLFAADYELSGRLENPRISVNPLSALAPGFFRKLVGKNVKPLTGEDALLESQ